MWSIWFRLLNCTFHTVSSLAIPIWARGAYWLFDNIMHLQLISVLFQKEPFRHDTMVGLGYFCSKLIRRWKKGKKGCFTIKIITRNYILSFKKVLKKCENWQKIFLILLTESQFFWTFLPSTNLAPSCTWKFGMSRWSITNLIIENWFWIQRYPQSKF